MKNWIKKLKTLVPASELGQPVGHSQFGEETYIKFIFDQIGPGKRRFLDVGAGGYAGTISNTRMLQESGWTGIGFDMNAHSPGIIQAFVKPDNIVSLVEKETSEKEFDFLNMDLDSFDYDILEELFKAFKFRFIIAEFNATLVPEYAVKLKYEDGYTWDGTNKYGFSFAAGQHLFKKYGYVLIFNQLNNNLFAIHYTELNDQEIPRIKAQRTQYHAWNSEAEWVEVLD